MSTWLYPPAFNETFRCDYCETDHVEDDLTEYERDKWACDQCARANDNEAAAKHLREIKPMALIDDLSTLLNRHSAENGSETPDFILAEYLMGCLDVYNRTTQQREVWYGRASTVTEPATAIAEKKDDD